MSKKIEWPKIDPPFKRKWLKALRSGEYKGATGELMKTLKNGEPRGFCCLGVAAVISGAPFKKLNGKQFITKPVSDSCTSHLPKELKNKSPLARKLANMNDGKQGFKRIADWIENNL
jgi:hypothetical protein